MVKKDEGEEKQVEKQVVKKEVRVEEPGAGTPLERREEITMEESEEVQELRVEIPDELQLTDDEMKKVAKDAANELLDTMSGERAAVRRIVSRIQRCIRIQEIQKIQQIQRIQRIWRG